MPICPKCHEEYDQGIEECADCMVPLEDQAEQSESPEESDGLAIVVFRAEDGDTLELMQRAVAIHHIPFQCSNEFPALGLKGHLMLVPAAMGEKVAGILDHGVQMLIGEGEGEHRIYRIFDQEREEEIRDPELLRASTSALVERDEEIIDELIEIVARGDQAARHRAAYVLACLGEKGVQALVHLLKVAIEKERQEVAISLIRVMRDEVELRDSLHEIYGFLHGPTVSRVLALQAIAALGGLAAFPEVLPMLSDEDPEVRDEADNTLCTLADEDMGFDTNAPEAERESVADKWKAWWSRRSDG